MLIMGDSNSRVGKYKNGDIERKYSADPCVLHYSKDYIVMDYGRILMNIFPLTNVRAHVY